jgi:GNAT superfamily N-acetyltransferase
MEFIKLEKGKVPDEILEWGHYRRLYPYENIRIAVVDGEIVAYIIEGVNPNGKMFLDYGIDSKDYTWILTWIQVKDTHKGKGYGSQIINILKDEHLKTQTPLIWFVQPETKRGLIGSDADLRATYTWYTKMGAVPIFHERWKDETIDYRRNRLLGFI